MARRKKARPKSPSAADVLAGRQKLRGSQILELVADINPTGRGLSAKDESRGYATKNQLLSLLVRQCAHELRFEPEPGRDGLVSVSHRHEPTYQSHAVLSELDADARSIVQRALDEVPVVQESNPDSRISRRVAAQGDGSSTILEATRELADAGSVEELLTRGRAALDEYDYETCEQSFRTAFSKDQKSSEVALELLRFLVDSMADYAGALVVLERLPARLRRLSEIMTIELELSVRTGRTARAADILRDSSPEISPEALVEAYVGMGEQALGSADFRTARDCAAKAGGIAESHPEISRAQQARQLAEKLRVAEAQARAPEEAELIALSETGAAEVLEEAARRLLSRWPTSPIARRILEEGRTARRETKTAEIWDAERQAENRGDWHAALASLRQLLALQPTSPELQQRIAELEDLQKVETFEAEVSHVVGAFAGTWGAEEIELLLESSRAVQQEVLQKCQVPALRWALAMPFGGRLKNRRAARATIDLVNAATRLAENDVEAALHLLERANAPEQHPEARRLRRQITKAREEAARELAVEATGQAQRAFDNGDMEACMLALDGIEAAVLSEALAGQVERLTEACGTHRSRTHLEARVEAARAREDYVDGVAALEELSRLAGGGDSQRVDARLADLAAEAHKAWGVRRFASSDEGLLELSDFPFDLLGGSGFVPHQEQSRVAIIDAAGGLVLLRVLDLRRQDVCDVVSLRLPQELGRIDSGLWRANDLWLSDGAVVAVIDTDRWLVRRWHEVRRNLPRSGADNGLVTGLLVPCDDRHAWVEIEYPDTTAECCVFDLERSRVVRRLSDVYSASYVETSAGTLVACETLEQTRLYLPSGRASSLRLPQLFENSSVASSPTGQGIILSGAPEAETAQESDEMVPRRFCVVEDDGGVGEQLVLDDLDFESISSLATAEEQGLVFVLGRMWSDGRDDRWRIWALSIDPATNRLAIEDSLEGNAAVALLDQTGKGPAVLVVTGTKGQALVELGLPLAKCVGRRLPEEKSGASRRALNAVTSSAVAACRPALGPIHDYQEDYRLFKALKSTPSRRRREMVKQAEDDPVELLRLARGLESQDDELALEAARRAGANPRHSLNAKLLEAQILCRDDHWSRLAAHIDASVDQAKGTRFEKHLMHLRLLAAIGLGDVDGATEALRRAKACESGECDLDGYDSLLQPVTADELLHPERTTSSVRELVVRITLADKAFAESDYAAAREALDATAVWEAREAQSTARLLAAMVECPCEGQLQMFRRNLLEVRFLQMNSKDPIFPHDDTGLPLLSGRWDEAALQGVRQAVVRKPTLRGK